MDFLFQKCLLLLCMISVIKSQKFAYVSVLSSNDFLLPAQVLAHRLKSLNDSIPYIVIVTEDITNASVEALKAQGVIIHQDLKIDTPYLQTHKARKYQYTKIRLWKMVEYYMIVHLDLDVLPLESISSLFHCGHFCASFRHSDMFNSGVFVLKTDVAVFNDMQKHVQSMVSYDGGDQGFLNSYFKDLKYSGMFNENNMTKMCENDKMATLSSVFNYDIGMYYLNGGRFLVKPKIIHYTMGPTKPWFWWTYPVFDLNHHWHEARLELGKEVDDHYVHNCLRLLLLHLMLVAGFLVQKKILQSVASTNMITENISVFEINCISHLTYLFMIYFNLKITPNYAFPIPTWTFFASNVAWMTTILLSTYVKIRSGTEPRKLYSLGCLVLIIFIFFMFYTMAAIIPSFGKRLIFCIIYLILQHFVVSSYIRLYIIRKTEDDYPKYHRIPILQVE